MGIEQAVAIESLLAQKTCGRYLGQYPGIIHPSRSNTVAGDIWGALRQDALRAREASDPAGHHTELAPR
jgi:hypothetical protein